ncbi:MAG: ABC transporter permease [Cellulomonas sp.]|uniref:ABC transporter permease n=1 Tax=unclassified Cellulomonas TaxID=2620175 RepID=UPI00065266EB|nr:MULTISPECIES: ABC transporter permease [unclassified Cellulomonas]KMM46083.1 peptide ABC transporter permease [Cellulomonas sp. A375-1]MCR6649433.1 ABC transporter permease [Cellulomonas sp.]MCR6705407.1 ABC transporter permease [Cellulomonas sp.]
MAAELVTTETTQVGTEQTAPTGTKRRFLWMRNTKALTGLGILAFFALIAAIGPWIAPYDPDERSSDLLQPPSWEHWMGTTHLGQDVMSQVILGTRSVLLIAFVAGFLATFIGVVVGITAGYVGGFGDEGLSALSNVFLVIPQLPLIIIIAGMLPSAGGLTVAVVIAITGWAWGARVLRAQTLSLRKRDFVEAARANGERTWRLILAEILPNLTAMIAAGFVGTVSFAVLSQITLSFIGITPTDTWNWGTVLYWAQAQLALQRGAWWWYMFPGLCIALVGISLTLINFGIDEFVNPRLRSTGLNAKTLRRRGIRPRIGFTPVVHEAKEDRA